MGILGLDRTRVAVTHCAWSSGAKEHPASRTHVLSYYPRSSLIAHCRTAKNSGRSPSARTKVRDRHAWHSVGRHISIRHLSRHPRLSRYRHLRPPAQGNAPTDEAPAHPDANLRRCPNYKGRPRTRGARTISWALRQSRASVSIRPSSRSTRRVTARHAIFPACLTLDIYCRPEAAPGAHRTAYPIGRNTPVGQSAAPLSSRSEQQGRRTGTISMEEPDIVPPRPPPA
ncbi:hypothetical protein PHLGIDRAFT_461083 [Phlebiopsis gigantea 11061_1 CR5-6]|uniref:Uncharacterized protein n=1 Tax=Phlebiopsis gigantea (strain 11061_1 CR5-6) TaxID=745531 RepID=A0A0C3PJQ0_PHLG1|nr:hypothetical protein PHLGIDRAFT_461083 [Phlebiopsis gigantea 11061_1 CR5-6]